MYKSHLLSNIKREIDLLKQLSTHINAKDLAYRPHEKMRSTYELMQYLSTIASYMMRYFIKNDLTPEVKAEIAESRKSLTIENFSVRLDAQYKEVQDYFSAITEEQLNNMQVEMPWKEKMPLGEAIIAAPVRWLAVYRMEIFVYLKMNGHAELATKDAWTITELTAAK